MICKLVKYRSRSGICVVTCPSNTTRFQIFFLKPSAATSDQNLVEQFQLSQGFNSKAQRKRPRPYLKKGPAKFVSILHVAEKAGYKQHDPSSLQRDRRYSDRYKVPILSTKAHRTLLGTMWFRKAYAY